MAIDTAKVTQRRMLRFENLHDALAEADRLAQTERAGKLRQLGNWTFGQALGHLAAWAEYSFTGAPLKPPFFIRWLMRCRKKSFLNAPMPAGVRIPKVTGGTLGTDRLSTDEGLERFRRAIQRLDRECPTAPNIIFGPLTHDQWRAINLRHAELHLGFFAE